LRAKLIIVDADGHREEHEDKDRKTAAAIMASLRMYGTTWDEGVRKHSYGWDEKLNVHKYDSRGNEIEIDVSTKSERWITTFDSDDREVETKLFRDGKLDSSYKYVYESDAYGNWIKKEESMWISKYAQLGYDLVTVYRRKIMYFFNEQ